MTDKNKIGEIHTLYLEEAIINYLSQVAQLDLRKAMDLYYSSRLSDEIEEGLYGIENLDYKYLTHDLIENEQELFA